jgi:hypothetical protein
MTQTITYTVGTEGATFGNTDTATLNGAILTIDTGPVGTYVINITGTINLTSPLLAINLPADSRLTIQGTSSGGVPQVQTIDGGNTQQRGLFVYAGTVNINDLTIQNMLAQGGIGGVGAGGGGAGLGGGLFVGANVPGDLGNVTLTNVTFANDQARGGTGGAGGGSGPLGLPGGGGGGGGGGLGGQRRWPILVFSRRGSRRRRRRGDRSSKSPSRQRRCRRFRR